jgi:hypothetical protein
LKNVLSLEPVKNKEWARPLIRIAETFKASGPFIHFPIGGIVFLLYEFCMILLCRALHVSRNPVTVLSDVAIFGLVTGLIFSYSRIYQLETERRRGLVEDHEREYASKQMQLLNDVGKRLEIFSQGIAHSLSAIMFFARAHLVKSSSPQMERDLREIMERIDQVQLLLQELKVSIASKFPPTINQSETPATAESAKAIDSNKILAEDVSMVAGATTRSNLIHYLRRSSRRVLILPINVRYSYDGSSLEFQTYTVNVCEDGACIIFSGDHAGCETAVALQMPENFETKASIKWIQPASENSFRLAGVEFLAKKTAIGIPLG